MEFGKESVDALAATKEKTKQIFILETKMKSLTKEGKSLLERTASLARQDQIQRASMATSNEEIDRLQGTVRDFEERF